MITSFNESNTQGVKHPSVKDVFVHLRTSREQLYVLHQRADPSPCCHSYVSVQSRHSYLDPDLVLVQPRLDLHHLVLHPGLLSSLLSAPTSLAIFAPSLHESPLDFEQSLVFCLDFLPLPPPPHHHPAPSSL